MEAELVIRAIEDAYRRSAPAGTEITVEQAISLGGAAAVVATWRGSGAELSALELWDVDERSASTRWCGRTDLVVLARRLLAATTERTTP